MFMDHGRSIQFIYNIFMYMHIVKMNASNDVIFQYSSLK